MILKLLLLAAIGIVLYRLAGGTFPTLKRPASRTFRRSSDHQRHKQLDDNTLVECASCGTYVTVKESIIIQGRYYCDGCKQP